YRFLIAALSDFILNVAIKLSCRILQRELKLHQHYSFLSCKIDYLPAQPPEADCIL
ncbi:MAG: hypothetical protein CG441_258, partial [Methylococcaceae bacterium NSM2-1]